MINLINIIFKKIWNFFFICFCLLLNVIGVYLIFPLPPFPKNVIATIIGLALIGAGGPLIFILCLIELSKIIKKYNVNYDRSKYGK